MSGGFVFWGRNGPVNTVIAAVLLFGYCCCLRIVIFSSRVLWYDKARFWENLRKTMLRYGSLSKREKTCLKYRWEFLRRNEEYRKDYRYVTKKLKVIDIVRFSYPEDRVKKVLEALLRWDLLNPIPPELSFDELIKSDKARKSVYIDSLLPDGFAIESKLDPGKLDDTLLYVKSSMVDLCVNMHFPKEKIMDEFNLLVDHWQGELADLRKTFKNPSPETRLQVDQYDRYLKVYDQHKKGLSVEQLSKKFYSGYVESSGRDYANRRVRRDIESCVKLIDGGFKQIR
jgi:hypothetical protein